jgi:hypothetical protein
MRQCAVAAIWLTMPSQNSIAERLLAHAKLCRQMASQTWNEEIAKELRKLAEECTRAATETKAALN